MTAEEEVGILAYTKSPKTSKRTSFQDELQAAVSTRANKIMMDQRYSDDFDEEEDDILKELLKSRKNKVNAFKASKSKMVNFEFSDEEGKPAKSKRVSFLKTQRSISPFEGNPTDPPLSGSVDGSGDNNSFSSNLVALCEKRSNEESNDFEDIQESTQRSLTPFSEGALQDTHPLLPAGAREESPELLTPSLSETPSAAKQLSEKLPPTPKPRQRVMAANINPQDNLSTSLDQNTSNKYKTSTCSSNLSEETHGMDLSSRNLSLSSTGAVTKSTLDSESKNGLNAGDSGDLGLLFEEVTISHPPATMENSPDPIDFPSNVISHISGSACDTTTPASQLKASVRSRGGSGKAVQSKYLGSLKFLDCAVPCEDPEPQTDSLRAAVYQEWLRKKKAHSEQNMEMKKREESEREDKRREKEVKKEDAIASYEAWKEKKCEHLKMKIQEQRENTKKAERAKEEKEEKRQAAKQVFEKWKHERDLVLKERCRKARRDATEQKLQKHEKEEERKRDSHSAFLEWSDKKKSILQRKAIAKHKELKDNLETEQYLKEEKDKMAVDMYESWLARKNLQKKQLQEEKWLHGILHDSPPPPWSPPNKTIPHGK